MLERDDSWPVIDTDRWDLGVCLSTAAFGFIYHPRQLFCNIPNAKPEICAATYPALAFSGTQQTPAWGSVVNPLSHEGLK